MKLNIHVNVFVEINLFIFIQGCQLKLRYKQFFSTN